MKRPLGALLPALGAALAACSLAPDYRVPDSPAPAPAFQEGGDWKQAQPADSLPRGSWWTIYQDARLDGLEDQAGNANQDLKAAFAQLQQARAEARIARVAYFPAITAGSTVTRSRTSANAPTYSPTKPIIANDFTLDADLSYEIDVWGRVRNTVAAARAGEQASAADLVTLDLSIRAELASDYLTLRSIDAQQDLFDRTVEDYARALQLEQNLYAGGAAALTDVAQAEAQLETARTLAADNHLKRAQLEHAIAVLVGQPATGFRLEPQPLPLDTLPPVIDPGLPSALLERRPDVAAAERRVVAANAGIGVARAAYFPVFSLTGAAGFESTGAGSWIEAPSRMWSIGPSALLTVFDAGLHRAQSEQAHAAYDEQVADYRGTVLRAYQEVEDNLAALRQLDLESHSAAAAVTATRKELQQANFRYKGGVATYLEVVTAENASLQAQLSSHDIQTRQLTANVLLVKALGGGWRQGMATPGGGAAAGAP
ncbi:MAG: efflux transporter outer membrane subunit [Nevskia sp.]|nr:efflux transporter outer membrane subunit [Nevskia sp.]